MIYFVTVKGIAIGEGVTTRAEAEEIVLTLSAAGVSGLSIEEWKT